MTSQPFPDCAAGFPWFPPDEWDMAALLSDQIVAEIKATSLVNIPYRDNYAPPDLQNPWKCTLYKNGAKVFIPLSSKRAKQGRPSKERGQITSMSPKSRRRASFAFGNAPQDWEWMATLTYQVMPDNPGADWKRFLRQLRSELNCAFQWGWIMEYQTGHNVHYHLFFGADFILGNELARSSRVEPACGRRGTTPVVRGMFDDMLVGLWCSACKNPTDAFLWFQRGGIVEPFRTPDAAARYVSKEAGKSHQKALPPGVDGGRRWWWLSPEGQPIAEGTDSLRNWPLSFVTGTVFDKDELRGNFISDPIRDDSPSGWDIDGNEIA